MFMIVLFHSLRVVQGTSTIIDVYDCISHSLHGVHGRSTIIDVYDRVFP